MRHPTIRTPQHGAEVCLEFYHCRANGRPTGQGSTGAGLLCYLRLFQRREEIMGIEKMPSGRKMESAKEDETCPNCRGKGTTGDSPNNIRMCTRCGGRGKIRAAAR